MKKVYLSGRITGTEDFVERFNMYENVLKIQGYHVINPLKLNHKKNATWLEYIITDITALAGCDAIALMPDWQQSAGCRIEFEVAQKLGLQSIHLYPIKI